MIQVHPETVTLFINILDTADVKHLIDGRSKRGLTNALEQSLFEFSQAQQAKQPDAEPPKPQPRATIKK